MSYLQGCQIVCLYTKNANFNAYLKALRWKILEFFMSNWNILGIFVHFSHFGLLYQGKSGNLGDIESTPNNSCEF
jgi:hypothetical protein